MKQLQKTYLFPTSVGVCKALASHITKNQIQSLGNNWKKQTKSHLPVDNSTLGICDL